MKLLPVTIDFETYYDKDYSVRKLKTGVYIRDANFHVHGVGIKLGDSPTKYFCGSAVADALANISWANAEVIGHNLSFDGLILTEVFGHKPARWFDTKALCNVLLPNSQSKNLDNCAKTLLGLKVGKLSGLEATKGKRVLDENEQKILANYCKRDVDLTYQLYKAFAHALPERERYLSSITTRMAAEPVLQLDDALLEYEVERLEKERKRLIDACPIPQTVLSSNKQFVAWIESQGLTVPMKISPSTDKPTPALANDDLGYRELQAENPQHKAVWDARRVIKSTIHLTRAEAFLNLARSGPCTMPMPLNYYGAHTGRWSGADGLNVQNLPRFNPNDPDSGALRRSILAPDGFVVVVLDLAQIELRLNAWFCGELDKLRILRSGQDIYLHAASKHYGYECNKQDHVHERFFGKMLELALGYGMGWRKLRVNAALGFMGTPPVLMSQLEAQNAVYKWRSVNARTKAMWDQLNDRIHLIQRNSFSEFNGLQFGKNAIILPNGMNLSYPFLRWNLEEESWQHDNGKKLYGGIMLENIIQALARIIIADHMYEIDRLPNVQVVGMTHDEIIAICPENDASDVYGQMAHIMTQPPEWAPDLPLAVDGGYAKNYSK